MAKTLKLFLNTHILTTLTLFLVTCRIFAEPVTKVYTFTSKIWEAIDEVGDVANWENSIDGHGFTLNQGVRVSTGTSSTTSPIFFKGITQIVFTYNTNKSSGEGTITVKIGNSEKKNDVAYSVGNGDTADYTTTFNYNTPQDGEINFIVNTTKNSIYIKSIRITYDGPSTPRFSLDSGTYSTAQDVELLCETEEANIYYTTDGASPTLNGIKYDSPIHIEETTTIKAVAIKDGVPSAVAIATYIIIPYVPILKNPNLSFDQDVYSVDINDKDFVTSLNKYKDYDGNVLYSSSNEKVAKVDSATGEVTVTGIGTTTITVSAKETENFRAAKTYYNLIVNDNENDIIIENGIFNFSNNFDYGSGMTQTGNTNNISQDEKIWTAGHVTLKTYGRVRWLLSNNHPLYLYNKYENSDIVGTCELSIPDGVITKIDINAEGTERLTTESDGSGKLEGSTWIGRAQTVTIKHCNVGNNVNITKLTVTYIPATTRVKIGEAQYTTYCNFDHALDFSDITGLNAYVVSKVKDKSVILTGIDAAPKETPVILNAPAGTYSLKIIESADEIEHNYLKVSDGAKKGGNDVYALASRSDGVGFYVVDESVTIPEGKCYLQTDNNLAKSHLDFDFEMADDISDVRIDTKVSNNGIYYNLRGQRVLHPSKGIYILNNRKVLIK